MCTRTDRRVCAALAVAVLLLAVGVTGATVPPTRSRPPTRPQPSPHAAGVAVAGAPYAGWPNHAHARTPTRWGYFGAETFAPAARWHRGYYGQHYRWTRYR